MKVEIRPSKGSDAKWFWEILSNPRFAYFPINVRSLEEEEQFLRQSEQRRKEGSEFNFAILCDGELVGGVGVRINFHFPHIGEAGYFVDEAYWGMGIATAALRQIEDYAFRKLELIRLELVIATENKASEQVAINCGYEKEGLLRKRMVINGTYFDCYLYAKVLE
ncbi:MAG: GNAT family N-acetyltransferase [Dehalococcoidia bacterium]